MIDPEHGAALWEVFRIGDMRSPGVCRVSGPGIVIGWDIQNASAQSGALTKRINEPLQEFEIEVELSNETDEYGFSDFDRWDDFQAYLEEMVAPGKKPFARDVYHPDLARVHITAATLKSIGLIALDGRGGGKVKAQFIEFRPPKPQKTGAATATKTEGDKKIDAANAEIKKLQEDYKKLDGGGVPAVVGSSLP